MTNKEKYNSVYVEVFGVKEEELNEGFTSESVEKWDSVTHMALVTAIEDAFDIMFDTDDLFLFNSYMAGLDLIKKYGVNL